jgi:hypothetical protein
VAYKLEHPKRGHFWTRKTKTGKTVLVGWVYIGYGRKKQTFAVRIGANPKKFDEREPDYIMTDWTREITNGRSRGIHTSYEERVRGRS